MFLPEKVVSPRVVCWFVLSAAKVKMVKVEWSSYQPQRETLFVPVGGALVFDIQGAPWRLAPLEQGVGW